MSTKETIDQVEQLAMQLPPTEQLKLMAHISDKLSRLGITVPPADAEQVQREREAMADALLQELDTIAESIEGKFDSAEDIRQIREERANLTFARFTTPRIGAEFVSCDDALIKKCSKHEIGVWCGILLPFVKRRGYGENHKIHGRRDNGQKGH